MRRNDGQPKAIYRCPKCGRFISRKTWIKFEECFKCWEKAWLKNEQENV